MAFALYFDEDAAYRALAQALQRENVDVLRAVDCGMMGRADDEHLAFASSLQRVLFSGNRRDFERLHWEWLGLERHHGGIVLLPHR